ncbi:MAG: four helix bundle protein [Bacteroidetes bacterium]|nr:four helix bundle protein [Bacteroidota bacterium]
MDKEELKKRTKDFSHRCVKLALNLPNTILGKHLQDQLIRCSTSVAANYRAACVAQSKASFTAKLSIVIEESDESLFWLEFINEEKLIKKELLEPLIKEAGELTAIFIASRKTIQKSIINNK